MLNVDGSLDFLPWDGEGDEPLGQPVGWSADDMVLLLRWTGGDPDEMDSVADVSIHEMSLDGRPGRTVELRPSSPWRPDYLSQWSASASLDGSRLLVVDGELVDLDPLVRTFSLSDGAEVSDPVPAPAGSTCSAGWAGEVPAVPIWVAADDHSWSYATTGIVDGDEVRQVVVAERWLGTRCFIWAADALAGQPRGGVFGLFEAWWTWWWREILLALGLVAGVVAVSRWRAGRQLRVARSPRTARR